MYEFNKQYQKFAEKLGYHNKFFYNVKGDKLYRQLILPSNIKKMIDATNEGKPALEGVLRLCEQYHDKAIFNLEEGETRSFVGALVGNVIGGHGYEVDQKNVAIKNQLEFFQTASTFKLK